VILTADAKIAERVKYSDYGIPLGMPLGDTDGNGTVDVSDLLNINSWWGTSNARGDFDLNGTIDTIDWLVINSEWGKNLGWGKLSNGSTVANRKGYAGYEFDPPLQAGYSVYHVRYRILNADLGRWMTRDPIGYVGRANLYEYVASNPLVVGDPSGMDPSGGGFEPGGQGRRPHTGPKKTACGPGNPYCSLALGGNGGCGSGGVEALGFSTDQFHRAERPYDYVGTATATGGRGAPGGSIAGSGYDSISICNSQALRTPLPNNSRACDKYGENLFCNNYHHGCYKPKCVCKCMGNDPWSQYFRACIRCMIDRGEEPFWAHQICMERAKVHGFNRPFWTLARCTQTKCKIWSPALVVVACASALMPPIMPPQ